ncbi:PREDICTED: transmembrane protein 225-like [Propithecus coquereli]|uniref:Transmembrane protein 225B n=1 Tax=Propithecus coquereli TaxID=379532 RepID=A0A2K6FVZ9_PROCO|nr:PREDICTED: transmembrane protein 225-like [Propithecus coquereli]
MLTLEDKDMKGFTWAIAPALTSLGYLLILLVSVFPFWVRLMNEESHEVFFSGLFENCFHIKCWKPRPLSIYILLGRVFLLSAVVLSFLTTFIMVSFASELFPRTRKYNFVSAFISFLTGAMCLSQEIACPSCHLLPISQNIEESQGSLKLDKLESLGGELSSAQKETLMKEETVI